MSLIPVEALLGDSYKVFPEERALATNEPYVGEHIFARPTSERLRQHQVEALIHEHRRGPPTHDARQQSDIRERNMQLGADLERNPWVVEANPSVVSARLSEMYGPTSPRRLADVSHNRSSLPFTLDDTGTANYYSPHTTRPMEWPTQQSSIYFNVNGNNNNTSNLMPPHMYGVPPASPEPTASRYDTFTHVSPSPCRHVQSLVRTPYYDAYDYDRSPSRVSPQRYASLS
eukprot:PhM_4_TR14810/c0_g1_i1/m.48860